MILTSEVPLSKHVTKQLDRKLGLLSVFSISVGAMMGSGIFVLPGLAAAQAGPWMGLSYLLAGLLVLPALFSKAELATAMPVAGGVYVYIDRSMGPWLGTIVGAGTWLALSAKTAFALAGLGAYLVLFTSIPPLTISLGVLGLLIGLNILGAGKVSGMQIAIVVATIGALLTLSFMAAPHVQPAHFQPAFPAGFSGIVAGAGLVFVSYAGVTKVCSVAEEIQNPDRNIPLGMLMAQGTVMALYALLAWVISGTVPIEQLATSITPVADSAGAALGHAGMIIFAIVAIVGLISMSNAGMLASTRYPFAMSRDKLFPSMFAHISPRFGTPTRAVLVTAVLLVLLVTGLPVIKLAKLASGFTIFEFATSNLAVMVLRETGARWYKPTFRSPLYPWTQLAGILGGIWILIQLGPFALLGVGVGIVAGSAWYFGYSRRHTDRKGVFQLLIGQARTIRATNEAPTNLRSQVIVPVFGGEPAPGRLVRLASAFVEHGELEVLRLEEVPEIDLLSLHAQHDEEADRLARQSIEVAHDVHVKVRFHDLLTHNAKEALHDRAVAENTDWIVLQRPSRRQLHYLVRHPMAWWLDHPPCHLAMVLDRGGLPDHDTADDFPRVAVLAQPGPYDTLIVHVADRIARDQRRGGVTLLGSLRPGSSDTERAELQAYLDQVGPLCKGRWSSRIVQGTSREQAMVDVSNEYDLMIMGSPGGVGLRTLFFPAWENRLSRRVKCSVMRIRTSDHHALHDVDYMEEETGRHLFLDPFLRDASVVPRLRVGRKNQLFTDMAHFLAQSTDAPPDDIERALWRVEQRQNTAFAEGIAVSAPSLAGIEVPVLGLFSLDGTVDYGGPDGYSVDVVVVILAAPGSRQSQLWLLRRLSRMALDSEFLDLARDADSAEGLRNAARMGALQMGEVTAEADPTHEV